jgi:hypothetical protein
VKYSAIVFILVLMLCGCSNSPATPEPAGPGAAATGAKPADEGAAIRLLGEINQAQADYMKRNRRYALTYDELIESHLMQQEPSQDATGYVIKLRPAADAVSYRVSASPVTPSAAIRYFFTDQTAVIRAEAGKEANASSPEIAK